MPEFTYRSDHPEGKIVPMVDRLNYLSQQYRSGLEIVRPNEKSELRFNKSILEVLDTPLKDIEKCLEDPLREGSRSYIDLDIELTVGEYILPVESERKELLSYVESLEQAERAFIEDNVEELPEEEFEVLVSLADEVLESFRDISSYYSVE